MEPILDNPAWSALNSVHRSFAQGTERAKRYRRGIVPFVAFSPGEGSVSQLNPWIAEGESFYIIGDLPPLPPDWIIELELPCTQMMAPSSIAAGTFPCPEAGIVTLTESDKTAMYALINSVQPGYYEMDTRLMGEYYGILQEGQLVSMAGERIRMEGFTEISAVCTHPAFTGRKYAQQLIAHICRLHYATGIQPFLHTAKSNFRAIGLYEHLGFTHRRDILFWRIQKTRTI